MNNDLISREKLVKYIERTIEDSGCENNEREILNCVRYMPAEDAVLPGVVEQYKWERDTAIAQLEELGIGFGQKKPDMVEVVRCKDCTHFAGYTKHAQIIHDCDGICTLIYAWCAPEKRKRRYMDYCSDGKCERDAEVEG